MLSLYIDNSLIEGANKNPEKTTAGIAVGIVVLTIFRDLAFRPPVLPKGLEVL